MIPARPRSPDAEPGERAEVVERADAAAGDQRDAAGRQHRAELAEVGALERAVATDLGDDRARRRPMPSNRCGRGRRGRRPMPSTQPRIATSLPRASSPTATRPGCTRGRAPRPAPGARPRRCPTTTRSTPASSSVAAPPRRVRTPPPDLRPCTATAAHDRLDLRRGCARLAGARGVEVDDVDPLRARGFELAGDAHRVVVVDGLGVEVALVQADAVAVPQVDRREAGRTTAVGSEACPWSTARRCLRSSPRRAARGPRP